MLLPIGLAPYVKVCCPFRARKCQLLLTLDKLVDFHQFQMQDRKINTDLAFKLGQVFGLIPNSWLLIQSKNDLMRIDDDKKLAYQKYTLKGLLKKVS